MRPQIPPEERAVGEEAARPPPVEERDEVRPAREDGRHTGARERLEQFRPDRAELGVFTFEERRVRSKSGHLGQEGAQGVVDGQRAVGAADADVHVQAAEHAPANGPAIFVLDHPVAIVVAQHSVVARERMRTRARPRRAGRRAPAGAACGRRSAPLRCPPRSGRRASRFRSATHAAPAETRARRRASARTSSFAGARSSVSGSTSISSSSAPTVPDVVRSNAAMQSASVSLGVSAHCGLCSRSSTPCDGDADIASGRTPDTAAVKRGAPPARPHPASARLREDWHWMLQGIPLP